MRAPAFAGLRLRLVLALVATSALTLAVAALALLSPLERRLRDDQVRLLRSAVTTVEPMFENVSPGDRRLGETVDDAAERLEAPVAIVDASGRVLASSARRPRAHVDLALRALRERRRIVQQIGSGSNAHAVVATPVRADGTLVVVVADRRLNESQAAGRVVRHAVLVAGLFGLAAALLVGLALATRLVRRLRALRDTALSVAGDGLVTAVPTSRARDEVGDLTRAFGTMQERLREQEEARRTFVSTASHELRTPLSSLRLVLDLAREELADDDPDLAELRIELERAGRQSDRLVALADQLLDLSRLDAGVPVGSEDVELGVIAAGVAREFRDRAAVAGATIEVAGADDAVARGDGTAVLQVLRILLDNAMRFAPRGTTVDVEIGAEPATATVTVRVGDRGHGVPGAERELIFERFRRGEHTGGEGGFGLGLAIARELAERMGGGLGLVSRPGPGACFELRLPAA